MAEREGVDPEILRAAWRAIYAAMPYEVALTTRFTEATLRHAPQADELREEVVQPIRQARPDLARLRAWWRRASIRR